jgi:hypothetical protein
MIYTAVAMSLRYFGKAYAAPAGKFALDCAPALLPRFGAVGAEGILSPSAAILVGMLSTAYMAHFNAPKVSSLSIICMHPSKYTMTSQLCLSPLQHQSSTMS